MKYTVKETGEDVTKYIIMQMEGKITRDEFIKITGIKE